MGGGSILVLLIKQENKIIILTISLIGTLTLTSCASTTVRVDYKCSGGSSSPTRCEGSATVTWTFKSTDIGFDASLASVDISGSSGYLISNNGTIVLTIKNTFGAVIASKLFNWYSSGSTLFPSSPTTITSWINSQSISNDYEVTFDVTGIETSGEVGSNTLVAEFNYDNNTVGGSRSFYLNNADLNGF